MARTKNRETTCSGAESTPGAAARPPGDGAAAAGGEAPSAGSAAGPRKPSKSSKEVYFAILPDKYQPLLEEEEEGERESEEQRLRRKMEKKRKKRENQKRCRKVSGGSTLAARTGSPFLGGTVRHVPLFSPNGIKRLIET